MIFPGKSILSLHKHISIRNVNAYIHIVVHSLCTKYAISLMRLSYCTFSIRKYEEFLSMIIFYGYVVLSERYKFFDSWNEMDIGMRYIKTRLLLCNLELPETQNLFYSVVLFLPSKIFHWSITVLEIQNQSHSNTRNITVPFE